MKRLGLGLIVLGIALVVWRGVNTRANKEVKPEEVARVEQGASELADAESGTSPNDSQPLEGVPSVPDGPNAREAMEARTVTLRDLSNARDVHWRFVPVDEGFDAMTWRLQNWSAVRNCPGGSATIGTEPMELDAPPGEHVLWVFGRGAPSQWAVVDSGAIELVCQPGPVAKLTVRRDGRPVSGAVVELFGTGAGVGGGLAPRVAAETFYQVAETDGLGVAFVERWPGEVAIVAKHAGDVSRTVLTQFTPDVTLDLVGTFEVVGRAGNGSRALTTQAIEVGSVGSSEWWPIGHARIAADGTYHVQDVPLPDSEEIYVQLLSGESFAPQMEFRPTPDSGSRLEVDFELEPARSLTVEVTDEVGRPLTSGFVLAGWGDGQANRTTTSWVPLDEKGRVTFPAVRLGAITLTTLREGFGQRDWPFPEAGYWSSGFVRLSYDPSNEVVIKLEDGEGRPLERGKLLTWQSNPKLAKPIELTSARQAVSFTEGHHWFVVHAPGRPRSELHSIDVSAELADEVVVRLPKGRRVTGRTVDANGQPVQRALVQPYVNAGSQLLEPFGHMLITDDEGRFSGEFLTDGDNRIIVQALDGKPTIYTFHVDEARPTDLGQLPVPGAYPLRFELPDALVAWGTHSLGIVGGVAQESLRDSATGSFEFANSAPGKYTLQILHPDESSSFVTLNQSSRGPWTRMLLQSSNAHLTYHPDLLAHVVPTGATQLHVTGWDATLDASITRVYGLGEESFSIPHAPSGRVTFQWVAPSGEIVGRSDMDVAPGAREAVRASNAVRGALLRFELANGEPLVGATIWYGHANGSGAWDGIRQTGPDGRAILDGLLGEAVFLGITHPTEGNAFDIELALAGSEHERRVVVDTSARLDVRFTRGGDPVTGVEIHFGAADPAMRLMTTVPDADGWAHFGRLGDGRYEVRVDSPGWFPVRRSLEVKSTTKASIELWRTGGLELQLIEAGAPGAGRTLELTRVGSNESVADWIRAGLVTGSLTTGADGRARLAGLPEGDYEVRALGSPSRFELVAVDLQEVTLTR